VGYFFRGDAIHLRFEEFPIGRPARAQHARHIDGSQIQAGSAVVGIADFLMQALLLNDTLVVIQCN